MTIAQSLKFAADKLTAGKIHIPHIEAEILLSEILKKPREFIIAHPEKKLAAGQTAKFQFQISLRLKGEPIAYLTGHKEFYGLNFKVNKNVLIPRPETELMVDEALKIAAHPPWLAKNETGISQPKTFIDVGAGSGCIAITLAKLIRQQFIAIDISEKALVAARKNAKLNGVNKQIKFLKGGLLSPIIHNSLSIIHDSLIILANLPYLTKKQIKNSPSIKREPEIALYAGKNGLALYEKLFRQAKKIKTAKNIIILCEFDPRQTAEIKQLIKRELPKAALQIKKDLNGLNRLVIIKIT